MTIHQQLARVRTKSLLVGVAGTAGCIAGALLNWQDFVHAYLYAYLFTLGLSLGALALVMIHNLTGGAWGLCVRRIAEAQMKVLPLMLLFTAPIAFGLQDIFPWSSVQDHSPSSSHEFWPGYLEPGFFYIRAIIYFAIWIALISLMSTFSNRQDKSPEVRNLWRAYKVSGIGLVVLVISVHFATIDWIMSVQRGFTSTALAPLWFSSQVLCSFALSLLVFCRLVQRNEFASIVSNKVMGDLGSLLFTMLVLWAYLGWFQYMLIWMADLPRDNVWYLVRWRNTSPLTLTVLVIFQFVLPLLALLFRLVKQSPQTLAKVAGIVFLGQLLFMFSQIVPLYGSIAWRSLWIYFVTPLALGGIVSKCRRD